MNPWTRVKVDEPRSRVEGGEPVLCDYAPGSSTGKVTPYANIM
jgi:hypothetical protein